MGISDGTDDVGRTQDGHVRRALLRRWARGLFAVAIVLTLPIVYPKLVHTGELRALVWWSRILAIVVGLGLLESTWRILRRRPA
jgi:hypothetical protein